MLDLLTIKQDPYKNRPVKSWGDVIARNLAAPRLGRTAGGRFTQGGIPDPEGDDCYPDSKYWRWQAEAGIRHLGGLMGDEYDTWAELTWPGETIKRLSWRSIRDMVEAAITAHGAGERSATTLAEAAHNCLAQLIKENE